MDPSKTSFAKLDGSSNYRVWSMKMKAYLIAQDLWDVVDITPAKASSDNLKSQNSKAVSLIIFSCEDHILQLIDPDDLAAAIWKKLRKHFGYVGFSARHLAFQSLVSAQISSCQSVEHYIDQFRTHINTLTQITTQPLPQWLLLSILINNVGTQYEAWSQSVMQQIRTKSTLEDSPSYFDDTIASLIDEARRMGQSNDNMSNTALIAGRGLKPKPICKHCGKIHKSDNCWEMFPEKRPSARFTSSNPPVSIYTQDQDSPGGIAFLSQSRLGRGNLWILDSGASQHMCNDKSQFLRFEPHSKIITIANGTQMNATGRGDVKIMTNDGNQFTLINVLYVPQLASNLLSVSYAAKNPSVRFNILKRECHIMFKTKIIATAMLRDSLFMLESINQCKQNRMINKSIPFQTNIDYVYEDSNAEDLAKSNLDAKGSFKRINKENNKLMLGDYSKNPIWAKNKSLKQIRADIFGKLKFQSKSNR